MSSTSTSPQVALEKYVWPSDDGITPVGTDPIANYDDAVAAAAIARMRKQRPGRQFLVEHRTISITRVFEPLGSTGNPRPRTIKTRRLQQGPLLPQSASSQQPKPLTPRMVEIVRLIAEGRSTKEIAYLLNRSVKTIESHRMNLMSRLDIHDVAGVVRFAMRNGLISTDPRSP